MNMLTATHCVWVKGNGQNHFLSFGLFNGMHAALLSNTDQKNLLFSLARRRCKSDLTNVYKLLKGGCKAARSNPANIFSAVSSYRTQGKGQKSKYRRLPLNIGKYFFHCEGVTEHWQRLSRVVAGLPFFEILKNHPDTVLLQATLLEQGGWIRLHPDVSRLQTQVFCDFMSLFCWGWTKRHM